MKIDKATVVKIVGFAGSIISMVASAYVSKDETKKAVSEYMTKNTKSK